MTEVLRMLFYIIYKSAYKKGNTGSELVFFTLFWLPFWSYWFATESYFSGDLISDIFGIFVLLILIPVVSLIAFPLGLVKYAIYRLTIYTLHRLLGKPRIVTD